MAVFSKPCTMEQTPYLSRILDFKHFITIESMDYGQRVTEYALRVLTNAQLLRQLPGCNFRSKTVRLSLDVP